MKKGTILAVERRKTTIFTDQCQIIRLNTKPCWSVGCEIQLPEDERVPLFVMLRPVFKPAMAVIGLILILSLGVFFSQSVLASPYAVVSLDINPSLQLELDQNLTVRKVVTFDKATRAMIQNLNMTGLDWQDAVQQWVHALNQNNQIEIKTILMAAVFQDQESRLKTQMQTVIANGEPEIDLDVAIHWVYSLDPAVIRAAKQHQWSIGREMLFARAERLGLGWDASAFANAPIASLVGELLPEGEEDQTRLTMRETLSLSDTEPAPSTPETNPQREPRQSASQEISQQQNITGATLGSTDQEQSRLTSTLQESSQTKQTSTLQETSQIQESSTLHETSQIQESSAQQETSQIQESSTLQETSQIQESSVLQETSQIQQTSTIKDPLGR